MRIYFLYIFFFKICIDPEKADCLMMPFLFFACPLFIDLRREGESHILKASIGHDPCQSLGIELLEGMWSRGGGKGGGQWQHNVDQVDG